MCKLKFTLTNKNHTPCNLQFHHFNFQTLIKTPNVIKSDRIEVRRSLHLYDHYAVIVYFKSTV